MGSALVGCLLGAILSGSLSDRFGRKRLLILAALVFVVSSLGTALVDSSVAFNVWRIAGGVAIGLASNLSPMYIAEIAPAAVRGRLVAMNQFTIVARHPAGPGVQLRRRLFQQGGRSAIARPPPPRRRHGVGCRPRSPRELAWQVHERSQRPHFVERVQAVGRQKRPPRSITKGVVEDPSSEINKQRGGTARSTPATDLRSRWWAAAWPPTTCSTAGGGCSA